jgi:hypothetical protein
MWIEKLPVAFPAVIELPIVSVLLNTYGGTRASQQAKSPHYFKELQPSGVFYIFSAITA